MPSGKVVLEKTVLINGRWIELRCDTGSCYSILNESTVRDLKIESKVKNTNVNLKSYNDEEIKLMGEVRVQVIVGKKEVEVKFIVSREGTNLLGLSDLGKLGMVDFWEDEEDDKFKEKIYRSRESRGEKMIN